MNLCLGVVLLWWLLVCYSLLVSEGPFYSSQSPSLMVQNLTFSDLSFWHLTTKSWANCKELGFFRIVLPKKFTLPWFNNLKRHNEKSIFFASKLLRNTLQCFFRYRKWKHYNFRSAFGIYGWLCKVVIIKMCQLRWLCQLVQFRIHITILFNCTALWI